MINSVLMMKPIYRCYLSCQVLFTYTFCPLSCATVFTIWRRNFVGTPSFFPENSGCSYFGAPISATFSFCASPGRQLCTESSIYTGRYGELSPGGIWATLACIPSDIFLRCRSHEGTRTCLRREICRQSRTDKP